jgi:hypothetical protein
MHIDIDLGTLLAQNSASPHHRQRLPLQRYQTHLPHVRLGNDQVREDLPEGVRMDLEHPH